MRRICYQRIARLPLIFALLLMVACEQKAEMAQSSGAAPTSSRAPTPAAKPHPSVEEGTNLESTKEMGHILYNPPTEMTLNTTETVEVRISRHEISEEGLIGTGEVQQSSTPISKTMSVRLCCGSSPDDPFRIQTASSEIQALQRDEATEWIFQVTPLKQGKHPLFLYASTRYGYSDGESVQKDDVFKALIDIQVDPAKETQHWFAENWQWLGLLLVIPLTGLLLYRLRKPQKSQAATSGNESVFISYRRDDSSGYTLAIYEKLKSILGDEAVFMDMDDIPHGENFAKHIEKVLGEADTVLVMIGQRWLNAANEHGRRLDNPSDFVRMEVATALTKNLRVIPVLLRGAQMPEPQSLPEELQDLCMRNAIRIHDDQFDASIQRLIQSINR